MKQNIKTVILTCVLTLFPMVVGLLLWNKMPDTVVTHWGTGNVPNGWSSKAFAVFGLPLLMTLVQAICMATTLNDPKKKNIGPKMMIIAYWMVPILSWICCFMIYATGAGVRINVDLVSSLVMGVLFVALGNYIPKSRQSYTVGIKLPWTLDSEDNWNRTSRLAGKLWLVGGLILCLNAFIQIETVIFAVILIVVIVPTVYSFVLYKRGV